MGGIYGVHNYDMKFLLSHWGGYTMCGGDLQRIQRYLIQDSSNAHAQIDLLLSKQKTKNSYQIFKLFKKSGWGELESTPDGGAPLPLGCRRLIH